MKADSECINLRRYITVRISSSTNKQVLSGPIVPRAFIGLDPSTAVGKVVVDPISFMRFSCSKLYKGLVKWVQCHGHSGWV